MGALDEDTQRSDEEEVAPTVAAAPGVGQRVAHYELEALLGEGGQARVYLALDTRLGRRVALKVFRASPSGGAGLTLAPEIARLAQLDHPHIVRLLDADPVGSPMWMAMQRIEGGSLVELIRRGPLSWRRAARLALQVAEALGHLHDRGIVHQDIKPGNLLLTRDDQAMLADLGVSALLGGSSVAGSAAWYAPERFQGAPADVRGDLYSLGLTIWALLAGRAPFEGSLPQLIEQHRSARPPSLAQICPDAPADLVHLVAELTAKDPADRPADAHEVRRRLARLLSHDVGTGQPDAARQGGGRGWPLWSGALLVGLVVTAQGARTCGPSEVVAEMKVVVTPRDAPGTLRPLAEGEAVHTGDCLALEITLSRAAYVWARMIGSRGEVWDFAPSTERDLTPLTAGRHLLPPVDQGCIELDSTVGVERLQWAASEHPLHPWPTSSPDLVLKGGGVVPRAPAAPLPCEVEPGAPHQSWGPTPHAGLDWWCVALEHLP